MLFKKTEWPPKMNDVGLGCLVVSLDQHHSVAEVLEAGLDCELHTAELLDIAAHAFI
jgi:hypothetical protein